MVYKWYIKSEFMNCENLRYRTKKGKRYKYCIILKKEIVDCYQCTQKSYQNPTNFKRNTHLASNYTLRQKSALKSKKRGINKMSKKKEKVTKETYDFVFKRDEEKCRICGSKKMLELHHINGRGKNKTNNVDNCIMLCFDCHHNKVHKNNKYWRPVLNDKIKSKSTQI